MTRQRLRWSGCLGGLLAALALVSLAPASPTWRIGAAVLAFGIAGMAVGAARAYVPAMALAAGVAAAVLPASWFAVAAGAFLLVLVAFFSILWWNTPYSPVEIRPGLSYRVGEIAHLMPDLAIRGEPPLLLRQELLDELLELARYADRLLARHDIEYAAAYGTVLGLLRHDGLIPWDDDVDFMIHEGKDKRRLAQNFAALAAEARGDGYRLSAHGPYWKLSRRNFWRYPVVDFYAPGDDQVEPERPVRKDWENGSLCFPHDPETYVAGYYGPAALTTIVHDIPFWDSGFVPAMISRLFGYRFKVLLDGVYRRLFAQA